MTLPKMSSKKLKDSQPEYCLVDMDVLNDRESDYYWLLRALLEAITELQEMVVALREEVDLFHPGKPYQHDRNTDIGFCFDDYRIAKEYSDLFSRLN